MAVKHVKIKPHTPEWHSYRYDKGIGGSEISSVMATESQLLSDLVYTPPIKWYLEKIGEPIQEFTGNIASESGHFFEGIIINWIKFWDMDNPNQLEMFHRIKTNTRVNKARSPKSFVENDKYPWLFYSPDAYFWKNSTGKKRLGETKNTTSMEARRYPNKVSPSFYLQVQQGLMITELEVADLCILVDGRWLDVVSIEPNKEHHQLIAEVSYNMWQCVLKAREIKEKYHLPSYFGVNPEVLTERQQEGVMLLSQLEPELTGSDRELDFIKSMIIPVDQESPMKGSDDQLELCQRYLDLNEEVKKIDKQKKVLQEQLILSLGGQFNIANFDDEGKKYFSYKKDVKGVSRLFIPDKLIRQTDL